MQLKKRLLLVDNYDSFTYNLVQMFKQYDLRIEVCRNDQIRISGVEKLKPDYIVISPGPKGPPHAGLSKELIRVFRRSTPILGVCLGMQCINEVFSGKTIPAPAPIHGKTTKIKHSGEGLYEGVSDLFKAALYHSLMVEIHSEKLLVTAISSEGVIMGVRHKQYPIFGVQYHPESFMTAEGEKIIENFLKIKTMAKNAKKRRDSQ